MNSNVKSKKENFYNHDFHLYIIYDRDVIKYSINVTLIDWHVDKVIEVETQNSFKFLANFTKEKQIRVIQENRERAVKYLLKKIRIRRYRTHKNYRLDDDEMRIARIEKKVDDKKENVVCIRQIYASSSNETIMRRETKERARKTKKTTRDKDTQKSSDLESEDETSRSTHEQLMSLDLNTLFKHALANQELLLKSTHNDNNLDTLVTSIHSFDFFSIASIVNMILSSQYVASLLHHA